MRLGLIVGISALVIAVGLTAYALVMVSGTKAVEVEELKVEKDTSQAEPKQEPKQETPQVPESAGSVNYDSNPSMDEEQARAYIAERESGNDYDAVSPSGKYIGKYQLSKDKLDGDYSPEHQEEVAEEYVMDRYGSWSAAAEHQRNEGWF